MKHLLLLFFSIPCFAGYLPNGVSSSTLNIVDAKQAVEWAYIANSGSACSVTSQGGSLVSSVSRSAAGVCALVFTSGIFSSAPACVCSATSGSRAAVCAMSAPGAVATTSGVSTSTSLGSTNTAEDDNLQIICMGPR